MIKICVYIPSKLSDEQKKLFKEIAKHEEPIDNLRSDSKDKKQEKERVRSEARSEFYDSFKSFWNF